MRSVAMGPMTVWDAQGSRRQQFPRWPEYQNHLQDVGAMSMQEFAVVPAGGDTRERELIIGEQASEEQQITSKHSKSVALQAEFAYRTLLAEAGDW